MMRRMLPCALAACAGPVGTPLDDTDPQVDTVVKGPNDTDSTDRPDEPTPQGATWTLGEPVVCPEPAARQTTPMEYLTPQGEFASQPYDPNSSSLFVGGGLTLADFDGDGRLDLMQTSFDAFQYWVQVDGSPGPEGRPWPRFEAARTRLPAVPDRTGGVTAVDLDDDGDLDAFVSVFRGEDVALINDGTGTFSDGTGALRLAGPPQRRSMSSSWADFDRDGDLDGFIGGYGRLSSPDGGGLPDGDPSSLFLRTPEGTYLDVVTSLDGALPILPTPAMVQLAHTFAGAWVDVEPDGWPDLFLLNDFGWRYPAALLRNDDASLVLPDDSGIALAAENMGLGIGDVDGDEVPDFLVTAWDVTALFLSGATPGTPHSGVWFDAARARGLQPDFARDQRVGWGNELADLDNDGDLDAVVIYGFLDVRSGNVNPPRQPDAVYIQQDDGTFVDVASSWGLDATGWGRGLLLVDLDRNGFLDLIRTDLRGPTSIQMARCDENAWLGLDLRQPAPNPFAVGARVRVGAGGRVWTRDVRAGGTGYGSGGPPEVHFGLGDLDVVDFVEVVWPDGTVSRREDVPTRGWVRVERS